MIAAHCKTELLWWKNLVWVRVFLIWVFRNSDNRRDRLQNGGRKAWAKTLQKAGLPDFPNPSSEAHICHEVDYGRSVTADDSATYGTVTLIVPMVFDSVPTVAETDTGGTVMLELLSNQAPAQCRPG